MVRRVEQLVMVRRRHGLLCLILLLLLLLLLVLGLLRWWLLVGLGQRLADVCHHLKRVLALLSIGARPRS